MTKTIAIAVIVISALSSFAQAGQPIIPENFGEKLVLGMTTMSPTMTTMLPTATTSPNKTMYKIVAAREDINYFVASKGAVRTAQFEGAMELVREINNLDQESASDMELAQAVLAELQ
jgi:uncharacterized protein (TIGR02448 family)